MPKKIKVSDRLHAAFKAAADAVLDSVSSDLVDGVVVASGRGRVGFVLGLRRRGSNSIEHAVAIWNETVTRITQALERVAAAHGVKTGGFELSVDLDDAACYRGTCVLQAGR